MLLFLVFVAFICAALAFVLSGSSRVFGMGELRSEAFLLN